MSFSFFFRNLAKNALLRIPHVKKVVSERNHFAAESRRLKRKVDELSQGEVLPEKISFLANFPKELPRKLHIGCGYDPRQGYLNVDLNEFCNPDLVADARSLPMLETGYFEEILAIDVLEHLHRDDTEVALTEWARLLSSGGKLHL